VAGFALNTISTIIKKPITTIAYIIRQPTTFLKRPSAIIFDTPARRALVIFIESDSAHRRLTLGEISHIMRYICSETTVRRTLIIKNLFRFIVLGRCTKIIRFGDFHLRYQERREGKLRREARLHPYTRCHAPSPKPRYPQGPRHNTTPLLS
jgi:hypothetical protein